MITGGAPPDLKKSLVSEAIEQELRHHQGSHVFLPCRAAVVVPDPDLCLRPHPSPPQVDPVVLAKAEPRSAALLVPAHLRKGETFAELAAGFAVGVLTAWRYMNETADRVAADRRDTAKS